MARTMPCSVPLAKLFTNSFLRDLDKLIFEHANVPVHLAEDPLKCIALGCGKELNMLDRIKENYIQVTN